MKNIVIASTSIMNKAAITIHVCVSVWTYVFTPLGKYKDHDCWII